MVIIHLALIGQLVQVEIMNKIILLFLLVKVLMGLKIYNHLIEI
jgi:hypothetical protein